MPQLDKFTYFSQFFWLCLFLFIFYIPIRNDGDGVLGISRILKLRNQLLSHRGNNIRSKDPKSLEDILRKGFCTGVSYMDSTLFEVSQWCKSVDLLGKRGFISPLRWQQVFGTGSAILSAFLALAGAAWSLDLTDLLYFNLLGAFYWLFIYLYLYIEIRWWVYERTKEWINKTWLFQKMKRAFTLEGQAIMFFLRIGFLIASFGLFVWSYKLMFGEVERGNLVNPLQVIAQVSCFLFYFRYPARVRHLLLLCFFLSLLTSLHLKGIDGGVLSFVLLLFLIFIFFLPLDYAHLIVFFGYFLDQGLAKWGFYLAFQQVGYHALSFFFERGQSSATPKKRIFSFLFLILIQTFYGLVHFRDFYFGEPLKLAALLSGACIIFISLAKRATWAFLLTFLFYFILSLFIGVMSSPGDKATIWGIPHGIIIFVFIHIWPFLGLFFFKDSLPRRKQPLVPLFFGGVFFLLGYFPELAWLEKWIEGIDLLLLVLGLFSFIEGEESSQRNPNLTKKIIIRIPIEERKFLSLIKQAPLSHKKVEAGTGAPVETVAYLEPVPGARIAIQSI